MNHSYLKSLVTGLFCLWTLTCTHGQSLKAEADLKDIMKANEAVGLAVVVVKDGEIVYRKSLGLKDIAGNTLLKEDDIFRIASISKSFSATAIMRLVEAKKVSLDDDFSGLVGFKVRNPKFPDKVITLRMVLSHTSSINDSQGYFNFNVINPDRKSTRLNSSHLVISYAV